MLGTSVKNFSEGKNLMYTFKKKPKDIISEKKSKITQQE